jgi:hypothetical protein
MNQDQVKERLLQIREDVEEFAVIFSGKKSKKAHGIYHPDTREIIIHNRNFEDENALMYTAIHEFAHHVHFTTSPVPVGPRAHNREFRSILHTLLARAEEIGVYGNPFASDPEFEPVTRRLREDFLIRNGELVKEFGAALIQAQQLCEAKGARFEDYLERVLALDKSTAFTMMKISRFDLDPSIGHTNMAMVAGVSNPERRREAEAAFREGQSPDRVRTEVIGTAKHQEPDPVRQLEKERSRIERTISSLQNRLEEIEHRLDLMGTQV